MSMTVYQFKFTDEIRDHSSVEHGIYFNLSLSGSKAWDNVFWKFYQPVASVLAESLDHAFEIMNLWQEDERVECYKPTRSLSVGDIVKHDGKFYMVEPFGFAEIQVPA